VVPASRLHPLHLPPTLCHDKYLLLTSTTTSFTSRTSLVLIPFTPSLCTSTYAYPLLRDHPQSCFGKVIEPYIRCCYALGMLSMHCYPCTVLAPQSLTRHTLHQSEPPIHPPPPPSLPPPQPPGPQWRAVWTGSRGGVADPGHYFIHVKKTPHHTNKHINTNKQKYTY
jgi:hypothetical protein